MTVLLSVRNIKKFFIEKKVLENISFDIALGEKVGLVGLNGAGKTTLVNIITGNLSYDSGCILWNKKSVNIGYVKQDSSYIKSIDCVENNTEFLKIASILGLEKVNEYNSDKLNNLSGGERTKVALSKVWSSNPDFLILDEPTNHLDYNGVQYLIKDIKSYKGTVLVISHDRYFLDQCTDKILEIEDGNINKYNGNYTFYREEKSRRYQAKLKEYSIQQETKKKINDQISTLKNWSNKAHDESRKKAISSGNKMGGKEYYRAKAKKKDNQIKSRIKNLEKIDIKGAQKPKEEKRIDFKLQKAILKGTRVAEAVDISKSFDKKSVFTKSSFYISRGERVGIWGNNGCGKTTLLKILIGEQKPDTGHVFFSSSSNVGYLSQNISDLDIESTVLSIFKIESVQQNRDLMNSLFNMGFNQKMLNQQIKTLSFGEITRLRIAKIILNECDVLILDEPLNHLDIHSREKLEQVLEDYYGTIIVVSHDRYMLQTICNKLLVFNDKKILRVEYNLNEYLEQQKKVDKPSKNKLEQKMLIENELAYIIGELSKISKDSAKYKELDQRYNKLLSSYDIIP